MLKVTLINAKAKHFFTFIQHFIFSKSLSPFLNGKYSFRHSKIRCMSAPCLLSATHLLPSIQWPDLSVSSAVKSQEPPPPSFSCPRTSEAPPRPVTPWGQCAVFASIPSSVPAPSALCAPTAPGCISGPEEPALGLLCVCCLVPATVHPKPLRSVYFFSCFPNQLCKRVIYKSQPPQQLPVSASPEITIFNTFITSVFATVLLCNTALLLFLTSWCWVLSVGLPPGKLVPSTAHPMDFYFSPALPTVTSFMECYLEFSYVMATITYPFLYALFSLELKALFPFAQLSMYYQWFNLKFYST